MNPQNTNTVPRVAVKKIVRFCEKEQFRSAAGWMDGWKFAREYFDVSAVANMQSSSEAIIPSALPRCHTHAKGWGSDRGAPFLRRKKLAATDSLTLLHTFSTHPLLECQLLIKWHTLACRWWFYIIYIFTRARALQSVIIAFSIAPSLVSVNLLLRASAAAFLCSTFFRRE